jgi:hypothetical protein
MNQANSSTSEHALGLSGEANPGRGGQKQPGRVKESIDSVSNLVKTLSIGVCDIIDSMNMLWDKSRFFVITSFVVVILIRAETNSCVAVVALVAIIALWCDRMDSKEEERRRYQSATHPEFNGLLPTWFYFVYLANQAMTWVHVWIYTVCGFALNGIASRLFEMGTIVSISFVVTSIAGTTDWKVALLALVPTIGILVNGYIRDRQNLEDSSMLKKTILYCIGGIVTFCSCYYMTVKVVFKDKTIEVKPVKTGNIALQAGKPHPLLRLVYRCAMIFIVNLYQGDIVALQGDLAKLNFYSAGVRAAEDAVSVLFDSAEVTLQSGKGNIYDALRMPKGAPKVPFISVKKPIPPPLKNHCVETVPDHPGPKGKLRVFTYTPTTTPEHKDEVKRGENLFDQFNELEMKTQKNITPKNKTPKSNEPFFEESEEQIDQEIKEFESHQNLTNFELFLTHQLTSGSLKNQNGEFSQQKIRNVLGADPSVCQLFSELKVVKRKSSFYVRISPFTSYQVFDYTCSSLELLSHRFYGLLSTIPMVSSLNDEALFNNCNQIVVLDYDALSYVGFNDKLKLSNVDMRLPVYELVDGLTIYQRSFMNLIQYNDVYVCHNHRDCKPMQNRGLNGKYMGPPAQVIACIDCYCPRTPSLKQRFETYIRENKWRDRFTLLNFGKALAAVIACSAFYLFIKYMKGEKIDDEVETESQVVFRSKDRKKYTPLVPGAGGNGKLTIDGHELERVIYNRPVRPTDVLQDPETRQIMSTIIIALRDIRAKQDMERHYVKILRQKLTDEIPMKKYAEKVTESNPIDKKINDPEYRRRIDDIQSLLGKHRSYIFGTAEDMNVDISQDGLFGNEYKKFAQLILVGKSYEFHSTREVYVDKEAKYFIPKYIPKDRVEDWEHTKPGPGYFSMYYDLDNVIRRRLLGLAKPAYVIDEPIDNEAMVNSNQGLSLNFQESIINIKCERAGTSKAAYIQRGDKTYLRICAHGFGSDTVRAILSIENKIETSLTIKRSECKSIEQADEMLYPCQIPIKKPLRETTTLTSNVHAIVRLGTPHDKLMCGVVENPGHYIRGSGIYACKQHTVNTSYGDSGTPLLNDVNEIIGYHLGNIISSKKNAFIPIGAILEPTSEDEKLQLHSKRLAMSEQDIQAVGIMAELKECKPPLGFYACHTHKMTETLHLNCVGPVKKNCPYRLRGRKMIWSKSYTKAVAGTLIATYHRYHCTLIHNRSNPFEIYLMYTRQIANLVKLICNSSCISPNRLMFMGLKSLRQTAQFGCGDPRTYVYLMSVVLNKQLMTRGFNVSMKVFGILDLVGHIGSFLNLSLTTQPLNDLSISSLMPMHLTQIQDLIRRLYSL